MLAENILISRAYDEGHHNNYANSGIRAWLNDEFVQTAFSVYERVFMRQRLCANDLASTGYTSNPNTCPATNDFVFLLSVQELLTKKYGFDTSDKADDGARRKLVTDYARALGSGISDRYPGTFHWWTRSSASFDVRYARPVESTGGLNLSDFTSANYIGIVPAIFVNMG